MNPVTKVMIHCSGYLEYLVYDVETTCSKVEATLSGPGCQAVQEKLQQFVQRIRTTLEELKKSKTDFNELLGMFTASQDLNLDERTKHQLYLKLCTLREMISENAKTNLSTLMSLRRDFLILKKELSKSLTIEGKSLWLWNSSPSQSLCHCSPRNSPP